MCELVDRSVEIIQSEEQTNKNEKEWRKPMHLQDTIKRKKEYIYIYITYKFSTPFSLPSVSGPLMIYKSSGWELPKPGERFGRLSLWSQ